MRQMIVEHPFGTIKRSLGFTYFLTRSNAAAKAAISLAFLVYNLTRASNILACDRCKVDHERIPPKTPNKNAHIESYHSLRKVKNSSDCENRRITE